MTIVPSFGDYPDFGALTGAMSAPLMSNRAFGPAAINALGRMDCTLFRTLRFSVIPVGGTANGLKVHLDWYDSVQGGVVIGTTDCTILRNFATGNFSLPTLGASFEVTISNIGAGTVGGLITLIATTADVACHAPGVYAPQFNAALGAGAATTVNVSPVLSGWATILARNNGGQPTVTFVEVLDAGNVWQPIAGVSATVAQQFNTFCYKHPPMQTRVTMGNIGVGATGAWSSLTFSDLSGG